MSTSPNPFRRRIFRVPGTDYMHEWETALAAHTDPALAAVRDAGFDAVWVRGILRDLVATAAFPELAPPAANLEVLRELVARCRRHRLDLFLYLNEPLCFPAEHEFWTRHPDVRGVPGSSGDDFWDHTYALCTSTPQVQQFLREAAYNVFHAVPDLGGAFLITASEHHTHCFSHEWAIKGKPDWQREFACPRCARRTPAEVIGEVVRLIRDGACAAKPAAEVIAWNWSWSMFEDDPQPSLVAALPAVPVLADFERGGRRRIRVTTPAAQVDKEIMVDEYSLAYCGPSERFRGTFDAARARGLPCYAKLQLGTTHEIATVPNLPLIPNLFRKFTALRELGVTGFLGCWNFGNAPSLNTFAAGQAMAWPPTAAGDAAAEAAFLEHVAREYFPGCDVASVVAAWHAFAAAMDCHPFSISFVYFGPVNYAPVYRWSLDAPSRPLQGTWYVRDDFGDQLEQCRGPFTMDEIETLLGALVQRWDDGVRLLEQGLAGAAPCNHAREELGVAQMIGHQFRSTHHIFQFYRCRAAWLAEPTPANAAAWQAVVRDELAHLPACLPLVEADVRLGYHAGSFPHPHHCYDAARIRRQVAALTQLLAGA